MTTSGKKATGRLGRSSGGNINSAPEREGGCLWMRTESGKRIGLWTELSASITKLPRPQPPRFGPRYRGRFTQPTSGPLTRTKMGWRKTFLSAFIFVAKAIADQDDDDPYVFILLPLVHFSNAGLAACHITQCSNTFQRLRILSQYKSYLPALSSHSHASSSSTFASPPNTTGHWHL